MAQRDGDAIQEIKARLDMVELVRRYVDLRQAGHRWVAPCPFHQETKPSFSVNPEEGFYYCFGCQAAGDVIDFYRRINGLEFRDALEQLAQEAGVALTPGKPPSPKEKQERETKRRVREMYELAARRFRENLGQPVGKTCQDYLANRRMSPEIVEQFGLGWAAGSWHDLEEFLIRQGYTQAEAVDAGLLARSEKGKVYDRFRDRLIFPIVSLSNQVVAFGGRIIAPDENAPKYINSTESPIYTKGDHLYGLAQARKAVSQSRRALLTEGYVDVITLHQYGFENACGVLGTALTQNQVKRLAGFCSAVDLLFDGDNAGRKAALRSAEMVLSTGMNCRVVLMPEGEDADSLLHAQGASALQALSDSAPDGLDFCMKTAAADFSPKEMLEWAKNFVKKLGNPELLSYYIPRIAGGLGLAEGELRRALASARNAQNPGQGRQAHDGPQAFLDEGPPHAGRWPERRPYPGRGKKAGPVPGAIDTRQRKENDILSFAIRNPQYLTRLAELGAEELLASDQAARLWQAVCAGDSALASLPEEDKRFWVQCREQAGMSHKDLSEEEDAEEAARREFEAVCQCIEVEKNRRDRDSVRAALRDEGGGGLELLRALQENLRRHNG